MSRKRNSPRTWMYAAFAPSAVLPVSRFGTGCEHVYSPCTGDHWDLTQCEGADCEVITFIVVTRDTLRRGAPVEVVQCDTYADAVTYADDHNRSVARAQRLGRSA